jgi:hypothetical protein
MDQSSTSGKSSCSWSVWGAFSTVKLEEILRMYSTCLASYISRDEGLRYLASVIVCSISQMDSRSSSVLSC